MSIIITSGTSFFLTPTHYVAPFATVGAASDEDAQDATAFSNATSSDSPCTVACFLVNALPGNQGQAAPGTYSSIASGLLGGTFVGRFEFTNAGTFSDPIVLFAQYPGAFYYNQPSLLSTFEQTYATQSEGLTDPIVCLEKDYLRLDGFHIDCSVSAPAANEGNFLISGSSTGCRITRSFVERAGEPIYQLDPNSAPLFSHQSYNAYIGGNRITGDSTEIQEDNDASIQCYKSDGLIIEHNYINGAIGIYVKADVSGGVPFLQDVVVRYNMVVDAVTYAFRTSTARSLNVHQNIFHLASTNPAFGGRVFELDGAGVDTYDCPVELTNNILISSSNDGAMFYHKNGRNIGGGEKHSNIFVDASSSGGDLARKTQITTGDDVDSMNRFNYNIWHITHGGSPNWLYNYDATNNNLTSFAAWQSYMAGYGTSPVYGSETYEANSSYSDPEFVSANYTNVELGNWRLAENAQDALIGSPSGGICGPYITGNEEIGLRADGIY